MMFISGYWLRYWCSSRFEHIRCNIIQSRDEWHLLACGRKSYLSISIMVCMRYHSYCISNCYTSIVSMFIPLYVNDQSSSLMVFSKFQSMTYSCHFTWYICLHLFNLSIWLDVIHIYMLPVVRLIISHNVSTNVFLKPIYDG